MKLSNLVALMALAGGLLALFGKPSVRVLAATPLVPQMPATPVFPTLKNDMSDLVTDSTGQLWGRESTKSNTLCKWNGHAWTTVSFPLVKGASADMLAASERGSVLCVWRFPARQEVKDKPDVQEYILSEHRDNSNTLLARWKTSAYSYYQLFGTNRATWLTSDGSEILRIRDGVPQSVYTIKKQQMNRGYTNDIGFHHNPLLSVEDSQGRTWFWSNELIDGFNAYSLRGLLLFDGKTWKHIPRLAGVPDKPYTIFQPRDVHTFWLGVGDNGLFTLNIDTLKATRVKEPLPHAFEIVQKIARLNGKWYIVSYDPEHCITPADYSLRTSDLWCWDKQPTQQNAQTTKTTDTTQFGDWKRVLHGLDRVNDFTDFPTRPIIATSQGLWVGALSGGVWWIPFTTGATTASQQPVLLDWRRNFPLRNTTHLFLQPTGNLIAYESGTLVPDTRLYLSVAPAQSPQAFSSYGSIIEDSRHHIWRIPSLQQRELQEWDGQNWTRYAFPTQYKIDSFCYLADDTRGRIWLISSRSKGSAAIFNPNNHTWTFFASYQLALQNQLKTLGITEFEKLKIGSGTGTVSLLASKGTLTFRGDARNIFYFDGQKWHHWTTQQITGNEESQLDSDQTSYFNKDGLLSVNLEAKTVSHDSKGTELTSYEEKSWHWMGGKKWKAEESEEYPYEPTPTPPVPPFSGIKDPNAILSDSNKTLWIVKDGQLYKSREDVNLCVLQTSPNERLPLQTGTYLRNIYTDARGNLILVTNRDWEEENFLVPHLPQPNTSIKVEQKSEDSFQAHFATDASGLHWFRWRLDGGSWSVPTKEATLTFQFVPSGQHQLEVGTLDAKLNSDPTPAKATLEVKVPSTVQIQKFLAMLHSPDYKQREIGIDALSRQPKRALPALRNARTKASPEIRWWYDVAIQQCEEQQKSVPAPS